jgi:hypothetical protein
VTVHDFIREALKTYNISGKFDRGSIKMRFINPEIIKSLLWVRHSIPYWGRWLEPSKGYGDTRGRR